MSVEINLFTNAITNYVRIYYTSDAMTLQLISSVLVKLFTFIDEKMRIININNIIDEQLININFTWFFYLWYYLLIIMIIYYIYKYSVLQYLFNRVKGYKTTIEIDREITINEDGTIYFEIDVSNSDKAKQYIYKFMLMHPEFFDTNVDQILFNMGDSYNTIFENKVYFNDQIHNAYGFIDSRNIEIQELELESEPNKAQNDIIVKSNNSMKLCINKDPSDRNSYIDQVMSYVNYQEKYGDTIKLDYIKILPNAYITHTFYDESVVNWQSDIKILKNEFFSPHKNYLFSIMEQKAEGKRKTTWNNLMLEGPPGTGKSSFIFRVALLLRLNILSVDLSMYIDRKKELYSMFHGGDFGLPIDGSAKKSSHNCIIVLEEFDTAINKIIEIENIHRFKKTIMDHYFIEKEMEINKKIRKLEKDIEEIDNSGPSTKTHEEVMEEKDDDIMLYYMKNNMGMEDETKMNIEKIQNKEKKKIKKEKPSYESEIGKMNNEMGKMISYLNEESRGDVLRFADLLELFQGPVPIKDRMIIATTNNYEEIKETLPALFRPGRLTTLRFDYIDWNSFKELVFYYFEKQVEIEEFEIKIPTSQLVELAIKHSINNNIDEFYDEILSQ